jgi:hypothetical protein
MVNPAAWRLLDFRRVNDDTFSWPTVLLAVAAVLVIGLLIAWGVTLLERRNRAESSGERIQQVVGDALARESSLVGASILPVARLPADGRPTLELTGYVPPADARRHALCVAERQLRRARPGMQLVDRLEVMPSLTDRRRRGA